MLLESAAQSFCWHRHRFEDLLPCLTQRLKVLVGREPHRLTPQLVA
jgi:hypothetical protein